MKAARSEALTLRQSYMRVGKIHVDKKKRGRTARSLWKWMKRRAAVELGIGHLKSEHRMERNRLHGEQGDMVNAVMSAAGMNFHKLLRHLALLWSHDLGGSVPSRPRQSRLGQLVPPEQGFFRID